MISLFLILPSIILAVLAPFHLNAMPLMLAEVGATIGIINGIIIQVQKELWKKMSWRLKLLYVLSPCVMSLEYFTIQDSIKFQWNVVKRSFLNGILGLIILVLGIYVANTLTEHLVFAGLLMIWGLGLCFHMGLALLNSCALQLFKIESPVLCKSPIKSKNLRDFWSVRWNRAFSDFMRVVFLKKYGKRLGSLGSILLIFCLSGIIHELVITIPLGRLYGLPFLYFLIQGVGMILEKKYANNWKPLYKKMWAYSFLIGPILLLFPIPFLEMIAASIRDLVGRIQI